MSIYKIHLVIGLFLSSLLLACTSADSNTSTEVVCQDGELRTVGIFGGKTVASDSVVGKGTVFILRKAYVYGEEKMTMCTGSLIDKNIVLTAGHCVPENENASELRVAFSVDPICQLQKSADANSLRRVERVRQHSDYSSKEGQSYADLAMLRFSGVAPENREPFRLIKEPVGLNANSYIYVAGYGNTIDAYVDDPSRPTLKLAQVKVIPSSLTSERHTSSTDEPILYFDQSQGQGACKGDSGGPTLLKTGSGAYIIGVNSQAVPLTAGHYQYDYEVTCRAALASVSVYSQRKWIQTTYKSLINFNSTGDQF